MGRTNAFVEVAKAAFVKDSGFRTKTASGAPQVLYTGPAHVSGPSRPWEKVEALEGRFGLSLHVETINDLMAANQITVSKAGADDGVYEVLSAAHSGIRYTFVLARRSTVAA
jgi:hypothetical protein